MLTWLLLLTVSSMIFALVPQAVKGDFLTSARLNVVKIL